MTARAEVRDTRDSAATRRRAPDFAWPVLGPGEIEELRIFLQDVLGIPAHARRFSVTFTQGECLLVSVDYVPREMRAFPEDTP